jgi:hypothetical protein
MDSVDRPDNSNQHGFATGINFKSGPMPYSAKNEITPKENARNETTPNGKPKSAKNKATDNAAFDSAFSQKPQNANRPFQPRDGNGANGSVRETPRILSDLELLNLQPSFPDPPKMVIKVLKHLLSASNAAVDCQQCPNVFAVTFEELNQLGIANHLLRWLVHHSLIGRRITRGQTSQMPKQGVDHVGNYGPGDRFVITVNGKRLWQLIQESPGQHGSSICAVQQSDPAATRPIYDGEKHSLSLNGFEIKKFRWAASNQERILSAFQEEGWPRRIDDPLAQDSKVDPKSRLHDTIKCLNRSQIHQLIKFRGDGTGQGVLWEIQNPDEDRKTNRQQKSK